MRRTVCGRLSLSLWLVTSLTAVSVQARPSNLAHRLRSRPMPLASTLPTPSARALDPASSKAAVDFPQTFSRYHLAVRTGFGLPWGDYANTRTVIGIDEQAHAVSADTHGVIPLWVEAGYWVTPSILVGVYGMVAGVLAKQASAEAPLGGGCPASIDCSAVGTRVGLQAQYTFRPGQSLRPWLGWAVGYEWMSVQLKGDGLGFDMDWDHGYSGPQFLQLQAGLDTAFGGKGALGPFLDFSAMQYRSCSANLGGPDLDCEVTDTAWHGWLLVGLRGALRL